MIHQYHRTDHFSWSQSAALYRKPRQHQVAAGTSKQINQNYMITSAHQTSPQSLEAADSVTSTVWIKKSPPPCGPRFSDIFWQMADNFKSIFTHPLCVPIFAGLQIFIQLSQTLTKLCHIKRNYLVHIICSKCPPSTETHAFRRLRKSLIALLIVTCGKSSQICYFYNVNKHVGYDRTSTVTSFAQ